MELLFGENNPEMCQSLGLDCGTCIRKAAGSVAKICYGLDSRGTQQIFFQLFPSPGCQPMSHAFELAYREGQRSVMPIRTSAVAAA